MSRSAQQLIPRSRQRRAHSADDINPQIRRPSLDSLHVAAVYFSQSREVILRQPALHPQAVDVFAESDAW